MNYLSINLAEVMLNGEKSWISSISKGSKGKMNVLFSGVAI